ncbi:MAG: hypothetical protein HY788_02800 [Deltaproteobacteria bacterium]|nr:hypothetical protein [Deltaproteobacteria bacterium]
MNIRCSQIIGFHHSIRIWAVTLGLFLLSAGLYRFSLDYVRVLTAFLFFILLPGICFSAWVFQGKGDLLEKTATAFGCGITFNALFFFVRGLVRFPVHYFSSAYLLSAIILVVLLLTVSPGKTRRSLRRWFQMDEIPSGPLSCVVLLCVILLFNENALLLTSDSLVYLPQIVEWQQSEAFGVDLDTDFITLLGRTRLYRMVIQPFLLDVTGTVPVVSYKILASILGYVFACSFYFFLKRIWDNRTFVMIGMLLFLCHFGGFWFNFIHSNYSWFMAWSLYFISIALVLDFFNNGSRRRLIIPVTMSSITVLFHGAFSLMTALSALSFIGCVIIFSKKSTKGLRYGAILTVIILFIGTLMAYGIDVLWVRLPILDHMGFYNTQSRFRGLVDALGRGYVVNPFSGPVLFSGLWGLLSVAFLPMIAMNRRRLSGSAAIFLISNTVFPLAVLFNPILVSVMLPVFTSDGVERLIFTLPYIAVVAVTVTFFMERWQANPKDAKAKMKAMGILTLVLLTGLPVFLYRILLLMPYDWGYKAQPFLQRVTGLPTGPFRYNHPALLRAMEFIKNQIRPEATFVTDPITAEMFPVLLANPVLEVWRNEKFPRNQIKGSRSMEALGSELGIRGTASLLRNADCEYVFINNSFNAYTEEQYFKRYKNAVSPVFDVGKFQKKPTWFRLIYDREGIVIFKFLREKFELDTRNDVLPEIMFLITCPTSQNR